MKDYSLDRESAKTFILNYRKENGQIIANLASGEEYIIPDTPGNEKRILGRMRSQVMNSGDWDIKQKEEISRLRLLAIVETLITIFVFIVTIKSNGLFSGILVSSGFAFLAARSIHKVMDGALKIVDYEKNYLFLNWEEKFRDITKYPNVLLGVSPKTKELFSTKDTLTINDLDDISYRDLSAILDNLEREKWFGFDYSNSQVAVPGEEQTDFDYSKSQGEEPIEGQIDIDCYISQSEKPSEEHINFDQVEEPMVLRREKK